MPWQLHFSQKVQRVCWNEYYSIAFTDLWRHHLVLRCSTSSDAHTQTFLDLTPELKHLTLPLYCNKDPCAHRTNTNNMIQFIVRNHLEHEHALYLSKQSRIQWFVEIYKPPFHHLFQLYVCIHYLWHLCSSVENLRHSSGSAKHNA